MLLNSNIQGKWKQWSLCKDSFKCIFFAVFSILCSVFTWLFVVCIFARSAGVLLRGIYKEQEALYRSQGRSLIPVEVAKCHSAVWVSPRRDGIITPRPLIPLHYMMSWFTNHYRYLSYHSLILHEMHVV